MHVESFKPARRVQQPAGRVVVVARARWPNCRVSGAHCSRPLTPEQYRPGRRRVTAGQLKSEATVADTDTMHVSIELDKDINP